MPTVSCPSPARPSHPSRRRPAGANLLVALAASLLAGGATAATLPASASAVSLVEVIDPARPGHLEELSRHGVIVIFARPELALGLLPVGECGPAREHVRVLGPADDGMEHYLLDSHAARHGHPEPPLPRDVRVMVRQGDLVVAAVPPGAIAELLGSWTPTRIFHRAVALRPRDVELPANRMAGDPRIQAVVDAIDRTTYEAIHQDIVANDGHSNRYALGAGGTNAQNKILALFQSYGYTNAVLHSVPGFPTKNVVATLPGATTPQVHYVVGAHYDSTSNSPGADDNGTGTAGVLLMAKRAMEAYQSGARFDNTLIFICFAAEEFGLYGSAEYAADAKNAGDDVRGMLNMDMIGYVDPGDARDLDTIAKSPSGSFALQDLAAQAAADYVPGWPVVESNDSSVAYQSDHASFWDEGYPAVFMFEDGYDYCPYIHSSQDTIGLAVNDYDFAVKNLQVVTATFLTLASPASSSQPVAAFTGTPLSGAAPLSVSFTDQSTGNVTAWSWSFGDGGSSAVQSPSHTYTSGGSFDVCLTVTGPNGSDSECKAGYVAVTGAGSLPFEIATGAGPGAGNPPEIAVWNAQAASVASFTAFSAPGYGADVASGNVDADVEGEHVAGPGPNPVYGPHVRGFEALGQPVTKLSFFAYGTLRFGTNVAVGDADGDGIGEVATGAGPGAVFGPHVRGFDFDGGPLAVLPGLSFFAFQTLKYGANAVVASTDPSPAAEILAAPGPGQIFGAQVRGFAYSGGSVSALGSVNFFAFPTYVHGAAVGRADLDDDGLAEILAAPGPAVANPGVVAAFNHDGGSIFKIVEHVATTGLWGARLAGGDVDADAEEELLTAQGPDPSQAAQVTAWNVDSGVVSPVPGLDFSPFGTRTHGARLGAADLGAY